MGSREGGGVESGRRVQGLPGGVEGVQGGGSLQDLNECFDEYFCLNE